ncbi:MAG: alpha/beta hydrolase [Kofleriaceae bacterium]
MTIEIAHGVGPDKLDIAYETLGDPANPPLLLIMGLGAQLITWPDGFCDELVQRGRYVIRFDNRDAGESTHMTNAPAPNYPAALAGDFSSVSYTLSNMAADAAGLLDHLNIPAADIVGASLGGFVAQTLAIEHRARVKTLTSIMSSTGDRTVGQPHPVSAQIFALGQPTNRDQAAERAIAINKLIGSPGFPVDPEYLAERARRLYDRSSEPMGIIRQAMATLASGDRTPKLKQLELRTLVIHGDADALVDVSGGRATAAAIAGSKLMIIPGMGHDLPKPLWAQFAGAVTDLVTGNG